MVRASQLLHPALAPVQPRPAATLLLLRDAEGGLEVLMTRRSAQARFAPGVHVFPGGAIDAADGLAHAQVERRATQDDTALTQAIAALRESFEELGILLARHADGRPADADDVAALDRHQPLLPQCAERGLRLACDQAWPLAHWVTSLGSPKRFDTAFLVARMPEGQTAVADETEQFEPVWLRPAYALSRHAAGSLPMMFPTIRTLEHLQRYADTSSALAACAPHGGVEAPLWHYHPRGALRQGRESRVTDVEAAYGELMLVCPDGHLLHEIDWQHESAVPLLRNLRRLTAANPGVMTGPGTNSYLVGSAATGYVVIDPGPDDATHVARLFEAAGGDIRAIVCTHSHPDHSPGARPLQALCDPRPPILGLPSAPTARPVDHFVPDHALADGERIVLASADGGEVHTLRSVHTPGHAANHLCLVLEEDALLFSGDHILNGSTTIVSPPDGHMDDYLRSLDRLAGICREEDIRFILPAHGHVLADAPGAIARLKAHRLAREARVAAAMQALPEGSIEDWVRHAYEDTPPALWPIAARSLSAHVERLRQRVASP
ncbi:MBL fold metallo-hydrolase [Xylophilus rhododendri]|uniref:MBL fold metallo-hydrolase n=1 Tax=Xylophilus rhododendri TaxID=2697032 RepID=A0A857J2C4_9BURK|nr:MBL fold metallo-hydrolase [Xylophilus rhododendri]QHI97886.1 MBL fold metallo-hydrolase [Xylophilus rhododendri]